MKKIYKLISTKSRRIQKYRLNKFQRNEIIHSVLRIHKITDLGFIFSKNDNQQISNSTVIRQDSSMYPILKEEFKSENIVS
jgi:glycerol-3-phosphate O-acyltransferase